LKNIGKDCDIPSETAVGSLEFSNEEPETPSLVSVQEVDSIPSAPEDHIFWLLNLSLYKILENNLQEAQFAVDEALKLAHGGCYQVSALFKRTCCSSGAGTGEIIGLFRCSNSVYFQFHHWPSCRSSEFAHKGATVTKVLPKC
jgi:hypothetical protein